MATERRAEVTWQGDLMGGSGTVESVGSGAFGPLDVSWPSRAEDSNGKTSPEELIAAAHAACYSMAFANYLAGQGHAPEEIRTEATITLDNGVINKMHLVTQGRVADVSEEDFKRLADEAEKKCPVSNLLRSGLAITLDASLL